MHLKAKDITALFGRFNISDESEDHGVSRSISQIKIHENYDNDDSAYADSNIAILILEEAVKFTDYIMPICLPSPSDSSYDVEGTIVGYGRLNANSLIQLTPHHAKLQSISPSECIKTHENAPDAVSLNNSFCAKSDTSVPCQGEFSTHFYRKLIKF